MMSKGSRQKSSSRQIQCGLLWKETTFNHMTTTAVDPAYPSNWGGQTRVDSLTEGG